MGLVREEYPGPRPPCLVPQGGVLRHEGLPLLLVSLDQTFLGALQDKPQTVEIVQAATTAQADAPSFVAVQHKVSSYFYELLDSDGREVLAYHWHPRGNSPVPTPHLHLEQGAQVGRAEVRDAHLPTGDVSLEAILRVLIEEMGVRPQRSDWESILTK